MLAPRPTALGLTSVGGSYDTGDIPSTPPLGGPDTPQTRFPHVRATLAAIVKQYKPTDLDDPNGDELARNNPALVNKVVTLLGDEDEEGIQKVLKENYAIADNDEVCDIHVFLPTRRVANAP